jgi:drug/metabolite transporter (DMT)-like permease
MIFLLLALVFSLCIMVSFKLFPRFGIDIIQALTTNYLVCAVLGFITLREMPSFSSFAGSSIFVTAIFSGFFMFAVFNVFALSAQRAGIAITAVSSKMSVIIPVLFGAFMFGESFPPLKIFGVALVMLSFYLVFKKKEGYAVKSSLMLLPLLLFLGNGTNDTILKFAQFSHITDDAGNVRFLAYAFGLSFIFGFLVLIFKAIRKKEKIQTRNIIAGVWLGLCNWISTLYFLKGLGTMDVSVFIPVFNAGLVSAAAIIGLLAFREQLSRLNIIGIGISVIAITFIAYGS